MKALTGIGLFEYLPDYGRPATQSTLFFKCTVHELSIFYAILWLTYVTKNDDGLSVL